MTTQLFRSKSCGLPSPSLYLTDDDDEEEEEKEEEEEEEEEEEKEEDEEEEEKEEDEEEEDGDEYTPISTPFIITGSGERIGRDHHQHQFPILEILVAALKKSLITCSVDREDICSMDIGLPTDVRHVSHVTFDRFDGFLGLPVEFEPDLPRRVPSASVTVFGVSANSMQCSHDDRGNSVPVILLMMQKRLYSGGGLQAEGIFRINAENSQEDCVRNQLNKGIIPHGIDVHCLAGLIKAWFRELPSGVLDSLTPDQVMHCNNEEECTQIVRLLPPTEAGLLDWAINLMADVVHQEHHNKMNARNIAMVFAPNMTQMADPLTALIHAVQVMNFLKTLIVKTLRQREESNDADRMFPSRFESPSKKGNPPSSRLNKVVVGDAGSHNEPILENYYHTSSIKEGPKNDVHESLWNIEKKREDYKKEEHKTTMGTTENEYRGGYGSGDAEGLMDKLSLRKGVKKLCRHRVFKLSKPVKKSRGLGIVNTREGGGEAWA